MWRLTLKQEKECMDMTIEQEIVFEDENQNNLLDLVRYLSECKVPRKTWFEIAEIGKEGSITIHDRTQEVNRKC